MPTPRWHRLSSLDEFSTHRCCMSTDTTGLYQKLSLSQIIISCLNLSTNKMLFQKSLFLLLAFAAKHSLAANGFRYQDNAECESPVSLSVDSFTCGDEEGEKVCDFGGQLEASGTLTTSEDLPEESCLTLKTCFMGMSFFCRSYTETIDLCDDLNLESTDGSTKCPSAGEYSFTGNLEIPSENTMSYGSGKSCGSTGRTITFEAWLTTSPFHLFQAGG